MKKIVYLLLLSAIIVSCGGKKSEVEDKVELKTFKDRLSYVLGAVNAQSIVGRGDKNMMRLDMELVTKGFKENLNESIPPADCETNLTNLFGPNFQDFDSTYAKSGAECLGRFTAYTFFREMKEVDAVSNIDLEMVVKGFRHGLLKKDTIVSEKEKKEIFQNFIKDIEARIKKKSEAAGQKMMSDAKAVKNARIFDNDIVIHDLKAGTGISPKETDDVKIEYILMNANGDTLQNSYEMKKMTGKNEAVPLNLQQVVPGWTFALPKMKKGGKYKLFVPWQMGYGEQGMYDPASQSMVIKPFESLCFIIELVDVAKEGTFIPKQEQAAMPQGGF